MSKNKQNKATRPSLTATQSKLKTGSTLDSGISSKTAPTPMLYKKQNYILMLAGVGLMFLGYLLMAGGSMPDAETWDPDLIYSTRRTLIAPILILAGLGLEVWAVFKR